jgi:hypothetical protein
MGFTFGLLLSLSLGASGEARAEVCSGPLSPWARVRSEPPPSTVSIKEYGLWQKREYEARAEAASRIFDLYLAGRYKAHELEACVDSMGESSSFLGTLQSVFYQRSLEKLRAARSPALQKFLKLYDAKVPPGTLPLFRLTGHFKEESPTIYKGGFHRASGSIFMDVARTPPGEWLVIFCHELLHSLDEKTWAAVRVYSQTELVKDFVRWSSEAKDLNELPKEKQQLLETWIEAGLDRGLWAEYRDFVATIQIYSEGKNEGLWPEIQGLEEIIASGERGVPLERVVYDFIDRRSFDPEDGIFSHALIQSALKATRLKARDALPELGDFSVFIRD